MKIKQLKIKNVKSFRDETVINLKDGVNIFVGPNASGKTNFLDILTALLRKFFLYSFTVHENHGEADKIKRVYLFNPIKNFLEPCIGADRDEKMYLSLKIILTIDDLENLKLIKSNRDFLKAQHRRYSVDEPKSLDFIDSWDIDSLDVQREYVFEIIDNKFQEKDLDKVEKMLIEYLNNLDLFLLIQLKEKDLGLKNPFFYIPSNRKNEDFNSRIVLSEANFSEYINEVQGSTSRKSMPLVKYALYYFATKKRKYEIISGEKWEADDEVKSVTKYLSRLNLGWKIILWNERINDYTHFFEKSGRDYRFSESSSGEKEILSLIFGLFGYQVKDGIVVIDEPELHLHPQWQGVLLEIFHELAKDLNIQFILITHSPYLVDRQTVYRTSRFYLEEGTSKVAQPALEEKEKDIFHIVNAMNNEKMFFADKVVLVEGVSDRIVVEKLIDYYKDDNNLDVIEVVDVGSKSNHEKYRGLLERFEVKKHVIADFDYLDTVGSNEVKKLFKTDNKRASHEVCKKDSMDGKSLITNLNNVVEICEKKQKNDEAEHDFGCEKEISSLKELLDYIKCRHAEFDRNENDMKIAEVEIEQLKEKNIHILHNGALEKYMPNGYDRGNKVEQALKFAKDFEEGSDEKIDQLLIKVKGSDFEEIIKAILED